ncbi:DUF2157 domain-containing protein [Nocardia sp. NPDC050406]|uniref:DUF2157 domain-containing protein n=1 Tax=Nocardia sp. NPDC050406 TaxID=3364318 RepID=UPI00378F1CCB
MTERSVRAALERLVDDGVLSPEQRDAVATAIGEARTTVPRSQLFAEIAAYVGAGLVLGGILLLLDSSWNDLDTLGKALTLIALIIGLLVGGTALAGGRSALFVRDGAQTVPRRLAAVLFVLAALCVAALVGILIDDRGDDSAWVWAVTAALVVAALGYAALPSVVGLLASAVLALSAVSGLLGDIAGLDDLAVGLGLLVLGGIWFALSRFGLSTPHWAGYGIAIATALIGAQVAGFDQMGWSYGLTLLVALTCFAFYAVERHAVLVIGGGVAIALAVSQAVWDWSDQAVGAAAAVVISGAALLGVGAVLLLRDRG